MIEIRKCIKCDSLFEFDTDKKSSNICTPCKREYQKGVENKKSKVFLDGYKEKYPYTEYQKKARFKRIQDDLKKINNRSEWKEYLKNRLDNLEQNEPEIIKWIFDRRSQEVLAEERVVRQFKKDEYEDTRITYQNKSWFD